MKIAILALEILKRDLTIEYSKTTRTKAETDLEE